MPRAVGRRPLVLDANVSEADLDQMERRAMTHSEGVPALTRAVATQYVAYYADDVPRLIAEIRRLRRLLAEKA
jgi:hypothetical protein